MARDVVVKTLGIRGNNHSDCAHSCRYCPIGRKRSLVSLERYAAFVQRVKDWVAEYRPEITFEHGLGYHANFDRDDLEVLRRLNGEQTIRGIPLGGLPWRNDEDLRDWILLLKEYGLQAVHATFGGIRARHDYWNNRDGNFDLLMRTLRIAGELDLKLGQRLLVGKSTLEDLEALVDLLETLPKHEGDWRYAMPFFYQTKRQKDQPHVEQDRIDEEIRAALPKRIRELYTEKEEPTNLSEREWIELTGSKPEPVAQATLVVRLTAASIDEFEKRPIADIISDLESRTFRAYDAFPSYLELLARYGDRQNTNIFSISRCVETKWLDAWRADNPHVDFEQELTHCWFGL